MAWGAGGHRDVHAAKFATAIVATTANAVVDTGMEQLCVCEVF